MTATAQPPTDPVLATSDEHHRAVGAPAYRAYVDAYDTAYYTADAVEACDPERHDLEAAAIYAGLAAARPFLVADAVTAARADERRTVVEEIARSIETADPEVTMTSTETGYSVAVPTIDGSGDYLRITRAAEIARQHATTGGTE